MRTLHINVIAVAIGIILFFVVAFVHAEPVVKCEPWSQTKCACHQKEDPKTGKCKKDANTYGCPCLDVTNGHPTPGTCITPEANGPNPHCKGSGEKPKGEGKPPEIPKPPESKPKEDKPKDQNQKPCNATSTPNVSGMVIDSGGTTACRAPIECQEAVVLQMRLSCRAHYRRKVKIPHAHLGQIHRSYVHSRLSGNPMPSVRSALSQVKRERKVCGSLKRLRA